MFKPGCNTCIFYEVTVGDLVQLAGSFAMDPGKSNASYTEFIFKKYKVYICIFYFWSRLWWCRKLKSLLIECNWPFCPAESISWMLMAWWCREPGHHTCQGYPGYFQQPHWKSRGLPEISRITWQLWAISSYAIDLLLFFSIPVSA